MKLPTPWITMGICWGAGKKHLYYDVDNQGITFHATASEAAEEADRRALAAPGSRFVVLQITELYEVSLTVSRYPVAV